MTQTTSRGCSSPSWHPPFLFQKPPCWAHLWWDNKTLISGWQCASAQGSVSRQTLHGTFPKKMKGKPLCTQNMKETQWISGRLMNFRWTVMRGKTWLVCTILNQGSHREGLFICPDTVRATETILDWTLTHKFILNISTVFLPDISSLRVLNFTTPLQSRYSDQPVVYRLSLDKNRHNQKILLEIEGNVPEYELSCKRCCIRCFKPPVHNEEAEHSALHKNLCSHN